MFISGGECDGFVPKKTSWEDYAPLRSQMETVAGCSLCTSVQICTFRGKFSKDQSVPRPRDPYFRIVAGRVSLINVEMEEAMEWIEQDTGGGVVCIGTDIPGNRCLILNADSAGIYEVTAERWFGGEGDGVSAAMFAQVVSADHLRKFLGKLVDDVSSAEVVAKWVEQFGDSESGT